MKPKSKFWTIISLLLLVTLLVMSVHILQNRKRIADKDTSEVATTTITTTTTVQITTSKPEEKSSTTTRTTTSTTKSTKKTTGAITKSLTTVANFAPTELTTVAKTTTTPLSTTKRTTAKAQKNADAPKSTTTRKATTTVANNATADYCPTSQEMDMFCTVVSSETGYCEDMAQKAVAHTVLNRLKSAKFPNTLYEVLTQRNQYSCVNNYFYGTYRKGLEPSSAAYAHTMDLIIEAMNEADFTNGAVAYYNPHMKGYNSWFEQYELVYEDQYGRFFKV